MPRLRSQVEAQELDGVEAQDAALGVVRDVGGQHLGDLVAGVQERLVGAEEHAVRFPAASTEASLRSGVLVGAARCAMRVASGLTVSAIMPILTL